MTDLAATLTTPTTLVDRVGVTRADVVAVNVMWSHTHTIHVTEKAASRIVPAHGDTGRHTTSDHIVDGVTRSHHHRVPVKGTDGKVVLLWITDAVVAQAA